MEEAERKPFFKDYTFDFRDCDMNQRAKLSTVMGILSEIGGLEYTAQGLSFEYLYERGFVFLLSRVAIQFQRMPLQTETLKVATAECGTKGASAVRGNAMYDSAGQEVVSCYNHWMICNPADHKIVRPNAFLRPFFKEDLVHPNCPQPGRIRPGEDLRPVGERTIRFSDVDANHHLYNAKYGDVICDVLPADQIQNREIFQFFIQFQAEAKLGETISLFSAEEPDGVYVQGRLGDKICFDSKTVFGRPIQK